ncbi:hypothetical protein ACLQ2R_05135 [Streptosporangium sp. DT93]|uniref:hypothetical protein n=1 Tax=Streptosporangium sp. DT93 TaxID=3393428 RepID=UPI003CECD274
MPRNNPGLITRDDGSHDAVIHMPADLGVDGAWLADWAQTLLWALDRLRSGAWDTPGEETLDEIQTAINDLEHQLAPRLDGMRDALIRAHFVAGGSYADLALALNRRKSTAQYRADKVLKKAPSKMEVWARGTPGPSPTVVEPTQD